MVGGLAIIVVGLAVSDKAMLGVLEVIMHPLAHMQDAVGSLISAKPAGSRNWCPNPPSGKAERQRAY